MSEPAWFAFRVEPQKEKAAEQILKRRGFTAFVPTEARYRRRSRRHKKAVVQSYPMLLGYVLMRFDGPVPWHEIFRLKMIYAVVGINGKPARLPNTAIDRLVALSNAAIPYRSSVNTRRSVQVGETVRIAEGPFRDIVVKVENIVDGKAMVVLGLFNADQQVAVSVDSLEAA